MAISDEKPSLFDQISVQRMQEDLKRHRPEEVVDRVLGQLKKDRERVVLSRREALSGTKKHTLEQIGQDLGITRERVRQIEKTAKGRLQGPEVASHLAETKGLLTGILRRQGGLLHEEDLLRHLGASDEPARAQAYRFLASLIEGVDRLDTEELGPAWRESHLDDEFLAETSRELREMLEREGKPLTVDTIVSRYRETPRGIAHAERLSEPLVEQILRVSRPIIVTEEGDVGLRHWREVNPRSIRDKTYLILRSVGRPMHFTAISEALSQSRWQKRPVTRQAVHNELIRDPRFVLVGRGIYGLAEWGHRPGTVSDVIKRVLEQAGEPLHKDEIVRRVLKERQVKEATIVLNLQEKTRFVRVKKATYALAPGQAATA